MARRAAAKCLIRLRARTRDSEKASTEVYGETAQLRSIHATKCYVLQRFAKRPVLRKILQSLALSPPNEKIVFRLRNRSCKSLSREAWFSRSLGALRSCRFVVLLRDSWMLDLRVPLSLLVSYLILVGGRRYGLCIVLFGCDCSPHIPSQVTAELVIGSSAVVGQMRIYRDANSSPRSPLHSKGRAWLSRILAAASTVPCELDSTGGISDESSHLDRTTGHNL